MSMMLVIPALMMGTAHADGKKDKKAEILPSPQPYGLVQAWLTVYDQDGDPQADPAAYGDPEDDMGFKLRRARLGFQGKNKNIKYGLLVGFASPYDALGGEGESDIQLVDAYGGYMPVKGVWFTGGLQKVPVGREMLTSSDKLAFTERSVATEYIVPGRDVGLTADARTGDGDLNLRMRVGAYNGNGSALGDDNEGLLYAGRAEVKYGPGNVYDTWGNVKSFTIGAAGSGWMDAGLGTRTTGFGGDLMVRVAGLAVLGEFHTATVEPVDSDIVLPGVLSETPRTGLTTQIGYSIKSVGLEPVVQFSQYDDHTGIDDNGDVSQGMGGLTWHSEGDVVRAGAGYVLRLEDAGAVLTNDSARLWFQLKI